MRSITILAKGLAADAHKAADRHYAEHMRMERTMDEQAVKVGGPRGSEGYWAAIAAFDVHPITIVSAAHWEQFDTLAHVADALDALA